MPRKKSKTQAMDTTKPVKNPFDFSSQAADLNRRRKWMRGGIFFVLAAIVLLWGWSLKINLDSFSWKNSKEQTLINNLQQNWQQNFSEQKTNTAILNDQEKNLVKDTLTNLIARTTSATSTFNTSTISNKINQ